MKNSQAVANLIKTSTVVKALPKTIVDWNLNRYHDTRVDNVPAEQYAGQDIELFPIESIVEPHRPYKGINKARIGRSVIAPPYDKTTLPRPPRFYVASVDDQYKYWSSPLPAVNGVVPLFSQANFPVADYPTLSGFDNLTTARPFVEYGDYSSDGTTFTSKYVKANKIVIKLENSWATPNDFDIVITRQSGTMIVADSQLTPGWEAKGEIVLRWSGSAWTGNKLVTGTDDMPVVDSIKKIQLVVRTLKGGYHYSENNSPVPTKYIDNGVTKTTDGKDGFVEVIEMGARLEADLSPWLISQQDTFELSDDSNLYPIGTVTSNQASLTLSNIYGPDNNPTMGLFSHENSSTIWYDYIEANSKITSYYVYYDSKDNVVDTIQQFVMYSDSWSGQDEDTTDVSMSDHSKYFNDIKPNPAMWENLNVSGIVMRLLDSVGFNNYNIDQSDLATDFIIPVFYVTGEDMLWDVLDELSKATQTAMYFDHNGVFQVLTREQAFDSTIPPVWTLQSNSDVSQLSNIAELSMSTSFEPNSFKVTYATTNWSAFNNGMPTMQKVWEPEDESVVLRATPLTKTISSTATSLWIRPDQATYWPFEGLMNVEGEIIRYKGKEYVYYSGTNGSVRNYQWVYSAAEVTAIQQNKTAVGHAYRSYYTGAMKITERGVWNSEPRAHSVDASGYSTRHIVKDVRRLNVGGVTFLNNWSRIQLMTTKGFRDYRDQLFHTIGQPGDEAFLYYGTKMRLVKNSGMTTQCAGMVISGEGSNESGYYIEITPSSFLTGKERKGRQELIVYAKKNGKDIRIGTTAIAIGENIDYDIDIYFNGNSNTIRVWLGGRSVFAEVVPSAARVNTRGRFGLFARGKTRAHFEYLYGVSRPTPVPPEDYSFLDRVERGYVGGQWDREWVYSWRTSRRKIKKRWVRERTRKNNQFFDEFGPIAHEVREYDVKFDPAPVLHSRLYLTNDWAGCALEYNATPFGGKFIIANTSRANAVIHGEDTASFSGTDDSINQVLTVFGRPLVVADGESVTAENTDQIRRRGKIESELSSPWIQSKGMAQAIVDWINSHFSYGNDVINITAFGNPLIQIGDVVRVIYPDKHINADFFVLSVNNSFESGLETTLTLRRRV